MHSSGSSSPRNVVFKNVCFESQGSCECNKTTCFAKFSKTGIKHCFSLNGQIVDFTVTWKKLFGEGTTFKIYTSVQFVFSF